MKISLSFLGGLATEGNLTGSCTAIETSIGKKKTVFLVDCGLVQGDFKNFYANNTRILDDIDPKQINFVIATHAHIDHIGLLPLLVSKGFKGKIICTRQTADLMRIMLEDSYRVQKELAKRTYIRANNRKPAARELIRKQRKTDKRHPKTTGMLFTDKDVAKALQLIMQSGFAYNSPIKLSHGVQLKFYPSGHILGSAICIFEFSDPKSKKSMRFGFSGDLGRQEGLLQNPPHKLAAAVDCWFSESTYGNERHPDKKEEIARLYQIVREAEKNGNKIIIPAFALQRSQETIYLLTMGMHQGDIPQMPIYLDAPMAIKITEVFAKHWDMNGFQNIGNLNFNPFNEENCFLHFVRTPEESAILLCDTKPPHIVISSSGMCDAGRVRDHLRSCLPKKSAIICLIGYMAQGSLGRKLKDGLKLIKMNGEEIVVEATIECFKSFSAHADQKELATYAKSIMRSESANRAIAILHGESPGGESLKKALDEQLHDPGLEVFLPRRAERRMIKI